jgi:hypothetical protein
MACTYVECINLGYDGNQWPAVVNGTELLHSMKGGEYPDQLSYYWLINKSLSLVES